MAFRPPAPNVRLRHAALPYAIGVLCLSQFGCNKVTSDSIELWKTTEKGPGKLSEAVADRATPPGLRAEAAAALVDIGKADEVEAALAAMPAGERWEVMKTLLPLYVTAMKVPSPEKALTFRDALFSLRALGQAEDQSRIDAALMPGIEAGTSKWACSQWTPFGGERS